MVLAMPYGDRKAAIGTMLWDSSLIRNYWAMHCDLPWTYCRILNFRVDSEHVIVPGNE